MTETALIDPTHERLREAAWWLHDLLDTPKSRDEVFDAAESAGVKFGHISRAASMLSVRGRGHSACWSRHHPAPMLDPLPDAGDVLDYGDAYVPVTWFESMTGVRIMDTPATLCPRWLWGGACRCASIEHADYDTHRMLDHGRRARGIFGQRCIIAAPYDFDRDLANEYSAWCARHDLDWCTVPVPYWHPATTTVLISALYVRRCWWHRPAAAFAYPDDDAWFR